MTEEQEVLIRYRLERAMETMAEAEMLAQGRHWNGCVNRLYYACFYTVTALLLRHGLSFSKHSSVVAMFNRHFVRTGLVAPPLGQLLNRLFQNRNRGDYRDLARFDEAMVRPWLEEVPLFLSEIGRLVTAPPSGERHDSGS